MISQLLMLLAAGQITALRVAPLPIYDANSVEIGRLSGVEVPHLPVDVLGANDFGFLHVIVGGRDVYLRPADVMHTVRICADSPTARRDSNRKYGAGTPMGVNKGAAEADRECVR